MDGCAPVFKRSFAHRIRVLDMERVQVEALIQTARELARQNVKYLHQGRGLNGLDCIGMVLYILSKHRVLPVDFERRNYGRLPMEELLQKATLYCERIEVPVNGCMVLIRWPGERRPAHVALYADGNLIHCYATIGKVVEHGYRKNWVKWTDSFYRLPGVIYE